MALVKKFIAKVSVEYEGESAKPGGASAREAEAQRKRARTLGKQQQAAERIAAAMGQFSSDINEAAAAAEQLKRGEGKKLGATGWLVKPVAGADLVKVIKQVLPGV